MAHQCRDPYIHNAEKGKPIAKRQNKMCISQQNGQCGILYAEEIKAPTFYGQGINGVADQPMTKERPWSTAVFMK